MNIHDIIKDIIITMLTNDLTIGRNDNDLQEFSNEEINSFLIKNENNIENVITTIIDVYTKDNDLELLENPLCDWIDEYLYDVIDIGY